MEAAAGQQGKVGSPIVRIAAVDVNVNKESRNGVTRRHLSGHRTEANLPESERCDSTGQADNRQDDR